MKLSIYYYPKMNRSWLIKRENGSYDQHAHFYSKKECLMVRKLIDAKKFPREDKYKIAMKRLLTEEEFRKLNKKERYFNVNKGIYK